jgi:hypothetical protein
MIDSNSSLNFSHLEYYIAQFQQLNYNMANHNDT